MHTNPTYSNNYCKIGILPKLVISNFHSSYINISHNILSVIDWQTVSTQNRFSYAKIYRWIQIKHILHSDLLNYEVHYRE